MLEKKEMIEDKIAKILKNDSKGLTITELVDKIKLNRSSVRIALARLDGADKVYIRKVGMAKLYFLEGKK